ncbi:uncharacterized protein [Nicotiana tomentosiformis]|uniref:uncharacterized protein n=1 Tax=Nicotiana tomentosiformis TaxID=4098 RepID=UPI00388C9445
MEKNADSNAQLVSHNTLICNLEVQMGQISQSLNACPKGSLPSDTVVNPKGGNNTGHDMVVTTRSGRGGNVPTSSQRQLVDDEQVVEEEEIPTNVVQANDEVLQTAKAPLPKPPPPFPQRLAKKYGENQFKELIDIMKSFSINVPLLEALEKMPSYEKYMKDLVTKKRSMNFETIKVTHQVSAIMDSMDPKLEDPGTYTIPCTIGIAEFSKALCDLRAKIVGVIKDVLVLVDKFIIPIDFVILDYEVDYEVPIILSRPSLAMGKALIDVESGELTFRIVRQPNLNEVCLFVDLVTDVIIDDTIATINVGDMLEAVFLNFDDGEMDGFVECVDSLQGMGSYNYAPRKLSLNLENRKTPPTKPSIEDPPIFELKPLPPHLMYEFLGLCSLLPVILSSF